MLKLTLAEKCALVSCFGDVPPEAKERLSQIAWTAGTGRLVGGLFLWTFADGNAGVKLRPSLFET